MEEKKEFAIKFKPTGNVFHLPEAEIDEIFKRQDSGDYEVIDDDYRFKTNDKVNKTPTVLEQILDNANNTPVDETIVAGDGGVFDENGEVVTQSGDTDDAKVTQSDDEADEQPDERLQELKGMETEDLLFLCLEKDIDVNEKASKEEIIEAILKTEE